MIYDNEDNDIVNEDVSESLTNVVVYSEKRML